MIRIRKAAERCHADFGWLDTRYSIAFNAYDDPAQMGFRSLRIINRFGYSPLKDLGCTAIETMRSSRMSWRGR